MRGRETRAERRARQSRECRARKRRRAAVQDVLPPRSAPDPQAVAAPEAPVERRLHTADDIKLQVLGIMAELVARCPQYASAIAKVKVHVSRTMTRCAGKARYREDLIKISLPYFADPGNFRDYLREVATHEIAHLVAGPGLASGPHGWEWKEIHTAMGGTGARCHTLELAEGYERELHEAQCPRCGKPMKLGPGRIKTHRAAIACGEKSPYQHKRCPR